MTAVPGFDGAFPDAERRVGKYRLLELVGRGAMGRVFAALDDHTERKVAIKLLNADLEGEPDIRTRFFREAQAAARLGHRNVITIYDLGEDQGRPFIVMELLRGWTLPNYLNEPAAADLERKVDLMVQLCDGMAAAHEAEIIHRDLKPGNLFVQARWAAEGAGFWRRAAGEFQHDHSRRPTGYAALHVARAGQGEEIDKRSDIFSAGGVFYFILTGRKPFPGQEWARVMRMLESEDPQALDAADAPEPLANIVMRCLAKRADARTATFPGVAADLTRFQRQYQTETRRLLEGLGSDVSAGAHAIDLRARGDANAGAGRGCSRRRLSSSCRQSFRSFATAVFDAMKLVPHYPRPRARPPGGARCASFRAWSSSNAHWISLSLRLAAGEQALAEGRYTAAVRMFEQIVAVSPDSRAAGARLSECRAILDGQKADAQRVKSLVREAQARARSAEWEQVTAICDEILSIDRTVPLAIALRDAGRAVLEQERQRAVGFRLEHAWCSSFTRREHRSTGVVVTKLSKHSERFSSRSPGHRCPDRAQPALRGCDASSRRGSRPCRGGSTTHRCGAHNDADGGARRGGRRSASGGGMRPGRRVGCNAALRSDRAGWARAHRAEQQRSAAQRDSAVTWPLTPHVWRSGMVSCSGRLLRRRMQFGFRRRFPKPARFWRLPARRSRRTGRMTTSKNGMKHG